MKGITIIGENQLLSAHNILNTTKFEQNTNKQTLPPLHLTIGKYYQC